MKRAPSVEPGLNEAEWIEQARAGDARAFRRLYDRHVDRVYGLAYRMVGDDDLARDITQEAFFRAYTRLEQFRGDAAFSTWLHTVTTSVALNELRKVKRHRDRERDLDAVGPVTASAPPTSDPHLRDRVRAAVESLPEIYRTVFVLHDVEGYNHGEIAKALDVAEGTSKARLSRARARLRDALSDFAPEFA
jgi:RNA polymerase sigma-70 factor (ECF subfamily)